MKEAKETFIPNSFQTPNGYVDRFMAYLTPEEFKVLIYAVRRIFGFQKRQDRISLRQFASGITRSDSSVLDEGTGLTPYLVKKAVNGLLQAGLLRKIEPAKPDRTPALYKLELDPAQVNIAFLEKRRESWQSRNRGQIRKARKNLEGGNGSTPSVQGNTTDPVQGNTTDPDRVTPQTPQYTGKTRRKQQQDVVVFYFSEGFTERLDQLLLDRKIRDGPFKEKIITTLSNYIKDYGEEIVKDAVFRWGIAENNMTIKKVLNILPRVLPDWEIPKPREKELVCLPDNYRGPDE